MSRKGVLGPASRAVPILVTGMPRTGTTWLARLLASAPGVALAGREPMNPRGRQYALAGSLSGWTRLGDPTPGQVRALRLTYRGLNPWVYSRYGRHQWQAPLPWTRVIVKDPFAMLSIPTMVRVTGAQPVLVYRHPGACLVSYRRMGWRPDLQELTPVVEAMLAAADPAPVGVAPVPPDSDEVAAMAWFWSVLYGLALHDVTGDGRTVVVCHDELAAGGEHSAGRLFRRLGLTWGSDSWTDLHPEARQSPKRPGASVDPRALHNLSRTPAVVAQSWRESLPSADIARIEELTEPVRSALATAAGLEPAS
ncbi:sulfotransferase [Ornithinicoccus halotolerans]|uniref:sulfotransferase n=1 Tax=Ornithinicoccus halotolerans TaxID=1748220 RepID=UPI00129775F3|nr:sulfotransferase [Ornithinicoccus halotolerans]